MGNNNSTTRKRPVNFENVMSSISDTDATQSELLTLLQKNIKNVIEGMKADVEKHPLIPNYIFSHLFKKLNLLCDHLDPVRPHVCYLLGNTNGGKSSLINAIIKRNICKVGNDERACTSDFQTVHAPDANAVFIDTEGFGGGSKNDILMKKFKDHMMKEGYFPDVILIVITRDHLKYTPAFDNITRDLDTIIKWLKRQRKNVDIPVMFVLNKIDEYFSGKTVDTSKDEEEIENHLTRVLKKVNEHSRVKIEHRIAVSPKQNFGIDQLRLSMNGVTPLNALIVTKKAEYVKEFRLSMVNKIIAAFSAAAAAVSFLPIFDIFIVIMLQEWMYRMLACFSIDPERTAESFKSIHRAQQITNLGIRGAALFIGGAFQLSVVGYLVGSAICVTTASASTAVLGWACYDYFTK